MATARKASDKQRAIHQRGLVHGPRSAISKDPLSPPHIGEIFREMMYFSMERSSLSRNAFHCRAPQEIYRAFLPVISNVNPN
jgi:hypothetical protein